MISASDSGVDGDSLSSSTISHTVIGQSAMSTSDDQAVSETLSDRSDDKRSNEQVIIDNVTSSPSRIAVKTSTTHPINTGSTNSTKGSTQKTPTSNSIPSGIRMRTSATVTKLKTVTPQVSTNVTGSRLTQQTLASAQRRKGKSRPKPFIHFSLFKPVSQCLLFIQLSTFTLRYPITMCVLNFIELMTIESF